jgi:hypothetical protein
LDEFPSDVAFAVNNLGSMPGIIRNFRNDEHKQVVQRRQHEVVESEENK